MDISEIENILPSDPFLIGCIETVCRNHCISSFFGDFLKNKPASKLSKDSLNKLGFHLKFNSSRTQLKVYINDINDDATVIGMNKDKLFLSKEEKISEHIKNNLDNFTPDSIICTPVLNSILRFTKLLQRKYIMEKFLRANKGNNTEQTRDLVQEMLKNINNILNSMNNNFTEQMKAYSYISLYLFILIKLTCKFPFILMNKYQDFESSFNNLKKFQSFPDDVGYLGFLLINQLSNDYNVCGYSLIKKIVDRYFIEYLDESKEVNKLSCSSFNTVIYLEDTVLPDEHYNLTRVNHSMKYPENLNLKIFLCFVLLCLNLSDKEENTNKERLNYIYSLYVKISNDKKVEDEVKILKHTLKLINKAINYDAKDYQYIIAYFNKSIKSKLHNNVSLDILKIKELGNMPFTDFLEMGKFLKPKIYNKKFDENFNLMKNYDDYKLAIIKSYLKESIVNDRNKNKNFIYKLPIIIYESSYQHFLNYLYQHDIHLNIDNILRVYILPESESNIQYNKLSRDISKKDYIYYSTIYQAFTNISYCMPNAHILHNKIIKDNIKIYLEEDNDNLPLFMYTISTQEQKFLVTHPKILIKHKLTDNIILIEVFNKSNELVFSKEIQISDIIVHTLNERIVDDGMEYTSMKLKNGGLFVEIIDKNKIITTAVGETIKIKILGGKAGDNLQTVEYYNKVNPSNEVVVESVYKDENNRAFVPIQTFRNYKDE